jgi:hypothetical protein
VIASEAMNHVFLWPDVTLQVGDNLVEAIGSAGSAMVSDQLVWSH